MNLEKQKVNRTIRVTHKNIERIRSAGYNYGSLDAILNYVVDDILNGTQNKSKKGVKSKIRS